MLKRTQSTEISQAISIGMEEKIHSQQFSADLVCQKQKSESCENRSVNAVVLDPAICVCDVINKAGTSGTSVYYIIS